MLINAKNYKKCEIIAYFRHRIRIINHESVGGIMPRTKTEILVDILKACH